MKNVTTLSHPDLQGHIADAIQDAMRRRAGRVMTTDLCRSIASDVIEHIDKLKASDGKECPACGEELRRDEDPYGVTYQCLAHDCFSLFSREEIEGDDHE